VIGSNITNILLIIGVTAFVSKGIKLKYDIMDMDMPLLLISSVLLGMFMMNGSISYVETALLLIALVVFLFNSFKNGEKNEEKTEKVKPLTFIILAIAGVAIYFSSKYTVFGLEGIATNLEIKKEIISLGALALGTSLPELVVSVAAIRRNNAGIAVGNVLGSNIFNSYAVVGIASMFGPLNITEDTIHFSIPIMIAITFLFAFMNISRKISRWEGFMLLVIYVYYIYELTNLAPAG